MAYQSTHTGTEIDNAIDFIAQMRDIFYPVGSIYTSTKSTSPATLFGGTWTQIKDRFLLCAGDLYSAGVTGGSATHTHTSAAHSHTSAAHSHTSAAHSHTLSDNGWAYFTMHSDEWMDYLYSTKSGTWYGNWGMYGASESEYYEGECNDATVLGGRTDSVIPDNTGTTTPGNTGSTTPGNTGSSSNLPPYKVVYAWERTA